MLMLEEAKGRLGDYQGGEDNEEDDNSDYVEDAEEAVYDDDDEGDEYDHVDDNIPTVVMSRSYDEPVKNHVQGHGNEGDMYENSVTDGPKGKSRNGTGKRAVTDEQENGPDNEKEDVDNQVPGDTISSIKRFFGWRGRRRSASPETRSTVADGSVSHTPSVKGRTYHEVLV